MMIADNTAKRMDVEPGAEQGAESRTGQRYLAAGRFVSMRLWDVLPGGVADAPVRRDYETVGFCIGGRAELNIEGQVIQLRPGDSWVVPKGAEHSYRILERFQAVEATAPPARVTGGADLVAGVDAAG